MDKRVVKLIVGGVLLLVILMVVPELFQMSHRPEIVKVVEDYERALCEFGKEEALARCTEDGVLVRNGTEIPFSSPEFYQTVCKHEYGIQTGIQFENFDIEDDEASVDVVMVSIAPVTKKVKSSVSYRISLKRIGQDWKIARLEEK